MLELNKAYIADFIEISKKIDSKSIKAIITDLPYSSTNKASSEITSINNTDNQFYTFWLKTVFKIFDRILKDDGILFTTIDWRGISILERIYSPTFRNIEVGIWNKECFGMGYIMRKGYETFVFMPQKNFNRKTASERDVWTIKWSAVSQKDHPSQKPVELMKKAIELVTNENDIILDPFCGTGSTALACIESNRNFIVIDNCENYINILNDKILQLKSKINFQ